jgi:hypothetical protein
MRMDDASSDRWEAGRATLEAPSPAARRRGAGCLL